MILAVLRGDTCNAGVAHATVRTHTASKENGMRVAIAGEGARIIASLKRLMKARSITYKELAGRIKLSEISVKRIFSQSSLSLARLEQICQALEVSIQEISRLSGEQTAEAPETVSLEQES